MTALEWLVETWFLSRAFDEAQNSGQVSWEEGFDPASLTVIPTDGHKPSPFPFNLSLEVRTEVVRLYRAGRVVDPVPSSSVARGEDGTLHAFACIRITEQSGVSAKSGMHAQLFSPELLPDLLHDIVVCDLLEKLRAVLYGTATAERLAAIAERARFHQGRFKPVVSSTYGGNYCLAEPTQRIASAWV